MSARISCRLASVLAGTAMFGLLAVAPAAGATTSSTSYIGTTSDGGSWVADVPSPWNGTVLLYSHGFGPLLAADAPDPSTKQALLDRGYALGGSSYDPAGSWWALGRAGRAISSRRSPPWGATFRRHHGTWSLSVHRWAD